jgi:hypothetical protein
MSNFKPQSEEMAELLRLMARLRLVSKGHVSPDLLDVRLTKAGRTALAQMYILMSECGFEFTTSKQRCLKVLFDAHIDKEMTDRFRGGGPL